MEIRKNVNSALQKKLQFSLRYSHFSMFPLLRSDGLTTVYFVTMIVFSMLAYIYVQMKQVKEEVHRFPRNLLKAVVSFR